MIDDKFIDGFIADAESISTNNKYIYTFSGTPRHVKSKLGIQAPYHSQELKNLLAKIKKDDRVFIHWYSEKVDEIISAIPSQTKIYLFFWGADFLESPSFSHANNPINRFLYDPLTFKLVQKKAISSQRFFRKTRNLKARESRNLKNIIATRWANLMFQFNTFSKKTFADGMKKRQNFLKRTEAICHWNSFDIQILEALYGVTLKQNYFIYNVGIDELTPSKNYSNTKTLAIWLGNSDTETNNHADILNELIQFSENNIKIICPLNYGNKSYSEEIAIYGKQLFGDRFIPLQDFLDRETYYSLMDEVDLAIMPHNRGQAGGNIIAFLKKGIKVYMKPQSSIYQLFNSIGITIFTIEQLLKSSINELTRPLSEKQIQQNTEILNASISNEQKRMDALKKILLNE
jgi:hypothetical protein